MKIYRGATYSYPIQIKINKEVLSLEDIQRVEFAFGDDLIKTYPSSDNEVERDDNKLIVKLTAEDTLSLTPNEPQRLQARVVFNDDSIKFTKGISFVAIDTQFSEEVTDNDM